MSDLDIQNLIPPFTEYLVKGEELKSITEAIKKRRVYGGTIVQRWYEKGFEMHLRVIKELDDLVDESGIDHTYLVLTDEQLAEVAKYDRIYQIGLQTIQKQGIPEDAQAERQEERFMLPPDDRTQGLTKVFDSSQD